MSKPQKKPNNKWVLPVIVGLVISSTIIMSVLIVEQPSSGGSHVTKIEDKSIKYLNFVYYFTETIQQEPECNGSVCSGGGGQSMGIGHGCTEISDGVLLKSEPKLTLADWIAENERHKQKDSGFDYRYFVSLEKGLYC